MTVEYKVITNPYNKLFGLTYEQVCEKLKENGLLLLYVHKQTEELCKLAVRQNSFALRSVRHQTPEICTLAVKETGSALQHVRNQTLELCKLAVQQNTDALKYVHDEFRNVSHGNFTGHDFF